MPRFTHILYTSRQNHVHHIKSEHTSAGSQQTFYRPIDIALLWHREVIVWEEFLTAFMDMLNFTLEGLKRQAEMLSGWAMCWVRRSWSHSVFPLYPTVWCTLTNDSQLPLNVLDNDAKRWSIHPSTGLSIHPSMHEYIHSSILLSFAMYCSTHLSNPYILQRSNKLMNTKTLYMLHSFLHPFIHPFIHLSIHPPLYTIISH